jgi:hypothetical protein
MVNSAAYGLEKVSVSGMEWTGSFKFQLGGEHREANLTSVPFFGAQSTSVKFHSPASGFIGFTPYKSSPDSTARNFMELLMAEDRI